jgi:hypothetical protein
MSSTLNTGNVVTIDTTDLRASPVRRPKTQNILFGSTKYDFCDSSPDPRLKTQNSKGSSTPGVDPKKIIMGRVPQLWVRTPKIKVPLLKLEAVASPAAEMRIIPRYPIYADITMKCHRCSRALEMLTAYSRPFLLPSVNRAHQLFAGMEAESGDSGEIVPVQTRPSDHGTGHALARVDTLVSTHLARGTAYEVSGDAQGKPRRTGRGLGWSDDELTALMVQGYDVSCDPVVGAGQKADKFADRIRTSFLQKMPPDACSATGTKCALDNRRWRGRQVGACFRKYKEVIRVCTRMRELQKRVQGLQFTGAPSEEDLDRVALALFNNVVTISDRELMYTIVSNPGYNVGRFEYAKQFKFLLQQTTLLEAGISSSVCSPNEETDAFEATEKDVCDDVGPRMSAERPIGNKAAKRLKRAHESLEVSEVVNLGVASKT